MSTDDNPYFDSLFGSFNNYIAANYGLESTSTLAATEDAKLYSFTAGGLSTSEFVNIAGNYKYSCIVPKANGMPPNYIGVLKENNALKGFIDELYSFTESMPIYEEKETEKKKLGEINCTRAAKSLYAKAYGTDEDKNPRAYRINFTDGMPYNLRDLALREVHMDITKQLNSIIDYAIATGQTASTENYDDVLKSRFLNMFFTESGKPRYYALRTGILPSAISYARYLQAKEKNDSIQFTTHYKDFEEEIDHLEKGLHFIPIGRSSQFLQTEKADQRLFWYPFSSKNPYSYKYDTSGNTTDKHKYVINEGFNHYNLDNNSGEDKAQASALKTVLNSISMETKEIDDTLAGGHKTVLSYKSCLSDIPAPRQILVTDSYNTMSKVKKNGKETLCYKGNLTETIKDIDSWANIKDSNNNYIMHPLLNYSGYKKDYLNVAAENYGSKITEGAIRVDDSSDPEELAYYNTGFKFQAETIALNRMNFYSTNKNDKSVDPYALEFGTISRDLYTVTNGSNKLKLNTNKYVKRDTFGVLGKLPITTTDNADASTDSSKTTTTTNTSKTTTTNTSKTTTTDNSKTTTTTNTSKTTDDNANDASMPRWQTISCGITQRYDDVDDLKNIKYHLFSVGSNDSYKPVPTVTMDITTIHYGGPYGGDDDPNENHGCNFWADDDFAGGYSCHGVYYVETGEDYHEGRYEKKLPTKDFNENNPVSVTFDTNTAVLGKYNQDIVYNLSNMTLASSSLQGYYYTVHILADDGAVSWDIKVNSATGKLDDVDIGTDPDGENVSKADRIARYGTGLQYFFGGNCDKSIFESYYNKGLTLFQLLDPRTDAYDNGEGQRYGRVINGLKYANRTFEWDYNVVLKAWYLALWIMNGYTTNVNNRANYAMMDEEALYSTKDAGLALAAFFDYIYSTNRVELMLGPSLKQINNAVGPYGSNTANDGTGRSNATNNALITAYGNKGATIGDNYDNTTLRGASWERINQNKGDRGVYDRLRDHAKVAATVFVNKDTKLHVESKITIGNNGVGRKYWSKGYVRGTGYNDRSKRSKWGEHWADARRFARESEGYLHLDHYSWNWHIDNEFGSNIMLPDGNNLWHGVFMLHARNPTMTKDNPKGNGQGYNSPFNWHLGPFHEVSPEAKEHTNEYGVRNRLVPWHQGKHDGDCKQGAPDTTYKQAWDGINIEDGKLETWDNQNPNIRIRLPMLWRYLKSLREKGVYTDGQLMPCGIELHYCDYRKSLMTSITNAEHTLSVTSGFTENPSSNTDVNNNERITEENTTGWQNALRLPSSVTFAEVMYDTYAITKNTISAWYEFLKQPAHCNALISDILSSIVPHSDKLIAMYRTKRYINSISNKLGDDGKTIYNIPILPTVSLFGATKTHEKSTVNSIVIASEMGITYNVPPDFDISEAKVKNVAIGVTHQPSLPPGQSANQFTAISAGLYADMTNFNSDTIGWIVPIPTKTNLALLDAYDSSWRQNMSSVIPLKMNGIRDFLDGLSGLHWIGWVKSDSLQCLEANDLAGLVHICYNNDAKSSSEGGDVAVVPMTYLRISPYYNYYDGEQDKSLDCNVDGAKCAQSNDTQKACKNITPFSFKFEIDTRGTEGLKLIMIHDMNTNIDKAEYNIYQISNKIPITPKGTTKATTITTYMTTISYDKDSENIPSVLRPL